MTEDATFEALKYRIEIDNNGTKRYYNNENQIHRIHGPAVICADSDKFWFLNGKLHRTDGPALEYTDGFKAWYINGERHRTDGPAVVYEGGYKAWYINDNKLTEANFLKHPLCTIKA